MNLSAIVTRLFTVLLAAVVVGGAFTLVGTGAWVGACVTAGCGLGAGFAAASDGPRKISDTHNVRCASTATTIPTWE